MTSAEFDTDPFRANLLKYTRKAYETLPALNRPRILDIGCGSGVGTLELARISGGDVIGIDIDKGALNKLQRKIEAAGLSDRVRALEMSLKSMDFPENSFDLLWAEGSIFAIGFKKGLKSWARLIKPEGFLVVHDSVENEKRKLKLIPECGYRLLDSWHLSKEVWMDAYFKPLEEALPEGHTGQAKKDLDWVRKNPDLAASVVFILQVNR